MAAAHSKLSNAILLALAGTCFATTAVLVYILKKSGNKELVEEQAQVQTSRFTILEVPVPADVVGAVIGRHGSNLEQIQKATSTKIKFRDEANEDGTRVAIIRGKPSDVHAAEKLVRTLVVERMNVKTEEMLVPVKAVGVIIGKNGTTIRMISDVSRAKVNIPDTKENLDNLKRVIIRGTSNEISTARSMIEDKVAEAKERDLKNAQTSSLSEPNGQRFLCDVPEAVKRKSAPAVEDLVPTGQDGFLEVYISAVESPGRFWAQPLGINYSTELDKLNERITTFYESLLEVEDETPLMEVKEGDIVAVKFTVDEKWYRATVVSIELDDYDPGNSEVELFYADFGDFEKCRLKDVQPLQKEFLALPFQAVECRLAGVAPKDSSWSVEASECFDEITYCCQWKALMLRVVETVKEENNSQVQVVQLVDTSAEINVEIPDQLVNAGFASRTE